MKISLLALIALFFSCHGVLLADAGFCRKISALAKARESSQVNDLSKRVSSLANFADSNHSPSSVDHLIASHDALYLATYLEGQLILDLESDGELLGIRTDYLMKNRLGAPRRRPVMIDEMEHVVVHPLDGKPRLTQSEIFTVARAMAKLLKGPHHPTHASISVNQYRQRLVESINEILYLERELRKAIDFNGRARWVFTTGYGGSRYTMALPDNAYDPLLTDGTQSIQQIVDVLSAPNRRVIENRIEFLELLLQALKQP